VSDRVSVETAAQVTHARQESRAFLQYLRDVTHAFGALVNEDYEVVLEEFFAPRVYTFMAKGTLDVIENSLRPLDRVIGRLDDRWYFIGSATLYLSQGTIQEQFDQFYTEHVRNHFPDASMQLAFASAACERLHGTRTASSPPSLLSPFIERMFTNVDRCLLDNNLCVAATSRSNTGAHQTPPATKVDPEVFASHFAAYRTQYRIDDSIGVGECSATKLEAVRLQTASDGVTDADAHAIALAACGANILAREELQLRSSVLKTEAPVRQSVSSEDVSATARSFYAQVNVALELHPVVKLEMPPPSPPGAPSYEANGLCALLSNPGVLCYPTPSNGSRLEIQRFFKPITWSDDGVAGALTQIAAGLTTTSNKYNIQVSGFASSDRARANLHGLPCRRSL
jgi:hypothetical protein